jgi:acyl dehydratase
MAAPNTFLTEEMRRKAIGIEAQPLVLEVEKGHVKRFAEAVGDPNPLWCDDAVARKSHHGGIVAPPTFLRAARVERPMLPFDLPFTRTLDGGSEWEYFEPIRAGDTITAKAHVADIIERSGRLGPMLITTIEHTYTNQLDEVVATQLTTYIRY